MTEKRKASDDDKVLHAAMGAIGAAAVAMMLGVFLYEAVGGEETPPTIALEVTGVERAGDVWLTRVRAHNSGDETAAQVEIEGTLSAGGETETATMTLDYLPDGSTRTGGLYFAQDPGQGELSLRVLGYSDP